MLVVLFLQTGPCISRYFFFFFYYTYRQLSLQQNQPIYVISIYYLCRSPNQICILISKFNDLLFAGRDASRAFATFTVTPGKEDYDDLSDLTPAEWESVREWEEQLDSKYTYVGKLLKPGETPTVYEEEKAEEVTTTATVEEKKDL